MSKLHLIIEILNQNQNLITLFMFLNFKIKKSKKPQV